MHSTISKQNQKIGDLTQRTKIKNHKKKSKKMKNRKNKLIKKQLIYQTNTHN